MTSQDQPAPASTDADWASKLKDPDPARRVAAIVALQHFAHLAAPHAPLLLELIDDPDRIVRERAAGTARAHPFART
jgi:hypothetical protein